MTSKHISLFLEYLNIFFLFDIYPYRLGDPWNIWTGSKPMLAAVVKLNRGNYMVTE